METDDDLDVGEFGIATRMVQPEAAGPSPKRRRLRRQPGADDDLQAAQPEPTQAARPEELGVEREPSRSLGRRAAPLDKRSVVIGRSRDCDIQLADPNVSRRHAEVRQEGATYWIVDLDSTNGIEVNGRRVKRAKLEDGDRVTLGSTELVFGRSFQ